MERDAEGPDERRWHDGDRLRRVFPDHGRIVGLRLAGETGGGRRWIGELDELERSRGRGRWIGQL